MFGPGIAPSVRADPFGHSIPHWGPRVSTDWSIAAWQRRERDAIAFVAPMHIVLVQFVPVINRGTAVGSDRLHRYSAPAGALEFIPAAADHMAQWDSAKDVAFFGLCPAALSQLAERDFGRQAELTPPPPGSIDPQLALLARLMRERFRGGLPLTELYTDAMTTMLGLHLLETYAFGKPARPAARGGLGSAARRAVLDAIAAAVPGRATTIALAEAAGLSVGHFMRAFRQEFGTTPHAMLIERRIETAEAMIAGGDPLAMVALKAGFSSQSHMNAAFRRVRGTTPGAARSRRQ